jgi:hypothetical protein
MGNGFVGIVHPSKLYNILNVGSPFLYIGPEESHITELAAKSTGGVRAYTARHGEVEVVVAYILEEAGCNADRSERATPQLGDAFSKPVLLKRLIGLLESKALAETELSDTSQSVSYVSAAR